MAQRDQKDISSASQAGSARAVTGRPKGGRLILLLGLAAVVGAVSTAHWLSAVQFPHLEGHLYSLAALGSGVLCVCLTTLNLLLRWFRWHFLIRRFTPQLVTRDSIAVYFSTLPAIMSPFFLAELGRVFLIRRRFRTPASYLLRVWFTERFLDFCVVGTALLMSLSVTYGALGLAALVVLSGFLFSFILRSPETKTAWIVACSSLAVTAFAWALPIAALFMTLWLFGAPVGVGVAVRSFSEGTLFGGITGLPLGVFVVGSTMIRSLLDAGVPAAEGVAAILVYRSGTAWFAVLLGLLCLVVFRKRLLRVVRGEVEVHFDEIADEYQGEIPQHVRERLLLRKIRLMERTLKEHGLPKGARGLDLGCGQGWYLAEMRRAGFNVDGTDYSQGQLDKALINLEEAGVPEGRLVQADAAALPFESESYDFVYSINAIHHLLEPGAQTRALAEIVRVLRPGGIFMLHEINTYNPLFRWYMGYLFPLMKKIDEGNEEWILPTALPKTAGASWRTDSISYFTFLPDFVPRRVLMALSPLEAALERSRFRRMSAHYQACLVKESKQA